MVDAIILKELLWISFSDELGGDELLAEKDKFKNLIKFDFNENSNVMYLFADGTWKYVEDIINDK